GPIETHVPGRAAFAPVGSAATLVVERFRQSGMEPSRPAATLLLGAVLSDTVLLNSPTTTERDREVVAFLERALAIDAMTFGRELFEAGSDVTDTPPEEIIARDAKGYRLADGMPVSLAQIEVVGKTLLGRAVELRAALEGYRQSQGHALSAQMVTDILSHDTELVAAGEL